MFQINNKTIEEDYNSLSEYVYLERSKSNILLYPTFSDHNDIDSSLIVSCLNTNGKMALKKVLWAIK